MRVHPHPHPPCTNVQRYAAAYLCYEDADVVFAWPSNDLVPPLGFESDQVGIRPLRGWMPHVAAPQT